MGIDTGWAGSYLTTGNYDGNRDIDETVPALKNSVFLSGFQLARQMSVAFQAMAGGARVDPMELGADVLPSGRYQDFTFYVEDRCRCRRGLRKAIEKRLKNVDLDDIDQFKLHSLTRSISLDTAVIRRSTAQQFFFAHPATSYPMPRCLPWRIPVVPATIRSSQHHTTKRISPRQNAEEG